MPRPPIPTDFAPYRDQISNCYCAKCREVAYAASDVLDFRGERHVAAAVALLRALHDGTHTHVPPAEYAEQSRQAKAVRLAEMRAAGASPEDIAAVERGYVKTGAL